MSNQPLILVVDDEPDFREIFSIRLKAAGYLIETALDGEEGIKKAEQLKPDLILMDMQMPVMDGATALLKLRDNPATKNMKVVFLSSLEGCYEDLQTIHEKFSEEFGAQGYLRKTDDLDSLVYNIRPFFITTAQS